MGPLGILKSVGRAAFVTTPPDREAGRICISFERQLTSTLLMGMTLNRFSTVSKLRFN